MARRQTFKVSEFRDHVNQMLANSDDDKTDGRIALALIVEYVLMESGNYSGFRFTDPYDDTRRHYYMSGQAF